MIILIRKILFIFLSFQSKSMNTSVKFNLSIGEKLLLQFQEEFSHYKIKQQFFPSLKQAAKSANCSPKITKIILKFSLTEDYDEVIQQAKNKFAQQLLLQLAKSQRYLTSIVIKNSDMSDQFLPALLEADWKFIISLDLSSNLLSHQAMKLLSKINFNYIEHFSIEENSISDKGLLYFCRIKWPCIKYARMNHIKVTEEGIKSFARHCMLKTLNLNFYDNIENLNTLRPILSFNIESAYILNRLYTFLTDLHISYKTVYMNEIIKWKEIFEFQTEKSASSKLKNFIWSKTALVNYERIIMIFIYIFIKFISYLRIYWLFVIFLMFINHNHLFTTIISLLQFIERLIFNIVFIVYLLMIIMTFMIKIRLIFSQFDSKRKILHQQMAKKKYF